MLEIDAAAVVSVTESGIRIDGAVDGVEVVPLEDHELVGTLVGADEKFAAHNAAMWEHGLLVRVARGAVVERPIYVRITNSADGGGLFWRSSSPRRLRAGVAPSRSSRNRRRRLRRSPATERRRRALRRPGSQI